MERYWTAAARRVAREVNRARWAEWAFPGVLVWSLVTGCLVLLVRREAGPVFPWVAGSTAGLLLFLALAFRRMRQLRFSLADGLVRLETVLGLHNRLTSAAAGVGEWPAPQPVDDGLHWRWGRYGTPLLLGLLFLGGTFLVPIPEPAGPESAPRVEEPLAWSEVEEALKTLREEQVTEPEPIVALEKKLESLRAQPERSWYTQSSLEAGESLHRETATGLARLERDLRQAEGALAQAAATGTPEAVSQWAEALKALQSGALPLNAKDLERLQAFQPGNGSPPSAEALRQMLDELRQQAGQAAQALGSAEAALAALEATARQPGVQGEGASGEPGPGGGHDPLGLRNQPDPLLPAAPAPLPENAGAALGDIVRQTRQTPEETAVPTGPAAGGKVAAPGSGGEAVWKNELTPHERNLLRRYFR